MFWWSFPPQRETKSTLYKPCLVAKLMVAAVFGRCCRRPCACISVMQSLSMEKKLAWFLKPLNTFIIYRLSKPPIYFCFWYHYWIHSHLCWSLFRMSWVHVLVGVWSLSSQYIHPTDRCRLKSAVCRSQSSMNMNRVGVNKGFLLDSSNMLYSGTTFVEHSPSCARVSKGNCHEALSCLSKSNKNNCNYY